MEDSIEKIKIQHYKTYKSAILDNIKNNTNVLTNEDLSSLFKKPPLDSMDLIKSKLLSLAKKNKIILKDDILDSNLDTFRSSLIKCLSKINKMRIEELSNKVINTSDEDYEIIIKFIKKDFNTINKNIKTLLKENYTISSDKFLKSFNDIFSDDIDSDLLNKIKDEITKFINGQYERQLLENVDIKILIKDTTLINLVKEQTERYLFTISNSRLFKDNI